MRRVVVAVLALGLAVLSKDAAGRQVFGGRYSRLRGAAGTTADFPRDQRRRSLLLEVPLPEGLDRRPFL
jgi:hypothetical protein